MKLTSAEEFDNTRPVPGKRDQRLKAIRQIQANALRFAATFFRSDDAFTARQLTDIANQLYPLPEPSKAAACFRSRLEQPK